MGKAHDILFDLLPGVVALVRAFGLDDSGLAPTKTRLPGMTDGTPIVLDEAAGHVHQLAAAWRGEPSDSVDPLLRMEADASAGRDLLDLESVWQAARSDATGDRLIEIDATYRRSTDALAATLAAAIEARTHANVDALMTHAGYIEAKHGVPA